MRGYGMNDGNKNIMRRSPTHGHRMCVLCDVASRCSLDMYVNELRSQEYNDAVLLMVVAPDMISLSPTPSQSWL